MITKLELKNFRGIKEGQLELAPLTILVGSNNSGKTAVLESLFLVPNPVRDILGLGNAAKIVHDFHQTLDSQGYGFLLFNYQEIPASVSCFIDGSDSLYTLKFYPVSGAIYLSDDKGPIIGQVQVKNGYRINPFASLSMGDTGARIGRQERSISTNSLLISGIILKSGNQYIKNSWASIMNSGVCRKVAEQASKLSTESYIDLTLEPFFRGVQSINVFLKDGRRIRLGDLGEGMQSYIVAKILYEAEKPDVLLWDDIEAHFNPRMLISLAQWFAELVENGKQVVLSTHSLEVVRIISEMVPDHTSIVLLSLKDNILNAKALSPSEIADLHESGIDVRIAERYLL